MKKILILAAGSLLFVACNNKKEDKKSDDTKTTMVSNGDKKPATEILDMSAADPVRHIFASFAKGDLDGMTADFDDSIRYNWSSGDSLKGKQAVKDYYAGRWKLIDSIHFFNDVVLPIQINESQRPELVQTGKWVLYWTMTNVTYKNGKKLMFWQHSANHFNDAGKIDFVAMYLDRHPIVEATKDLMK